MGDTFYVGDSITFSASGDCMDIVPTDYARRFVPVSWTVNPEGSWSNAPYTASFSIATAGAYTLSVTFREQVYIDGEWTNTNLTDEKAIEFSVKEKQPAVTPTPTPTVTPTTTSTPSPTPTTVPETTTEPTGVPTAAPTSAPTAAPTSAPTAAPVVTQAPTATPSVTNAPTATPAITYTGNLKIVVTEENTGERLPDISVKIKRPDGQKETYKTDEDGEVLLMDIPVGTYEIITPFSTAEDDVAVEKIANAEVKRGETCICETNAVPAKSAVQEPTAEPTKVPETEAPTEEPTTVPTSTPELEDVIIDSGNIEDDKSASPLIWGGVAAIGGGFLLFVLLKRRKK